MLMIRTPLGDESLELEEFEERVRRGELTPDTLVCFPPVTGEGWVCARNLELFRGLYNPERLYFTRHFSLSRVPLLTLLVVSANLLMFLVLLSALPRGADEHVLTGKLVGFGAVAPSLIVDLGETWRLLTANFLHRDVFHLAFNMLFLFNAAGALENAFRPSQYVAVLLASALGATVCSLLLSGSISAGASGIVFGCLGGLVVFGVKYRAIIPARFRRYFGLAVAPYVAVFLWMGWMSAGVDNWGHLGGLLAGAVTTMFLRPRLLVESPRGRWHGVVLWPALVIVVLVVTVGGPVLSKPLRNTVTYRDDASGLVIDYPAGWTRTVTSLGELGLGNGLPQPVWVQAGANLIPSDADGSTVADRWLSAQLHRAEQAGRIRSSRWRSRGEANIAGCPALVYEAAFEVLEQGRKVADYRLRLYVFVRGDLAYRVALFGPVGLFPGYRSTLYEIVDGIRLEEPAFLRRARARFLVSPGDESARTLLDEAVRRAGHTGGAVRHRPCDP